MAIKMYCGIMGSGKTYEVVSEVIINSMRQGRRVVSNIAGLNADALRAILVEEGTPEDVIGELVQVEHERIMRPDFWRTDTDDKTGRQPFIQKGDVLCLDEIWRFWNGFSSRDDEGNRIPSECKNYFRMHRQFPDPVTGFTCENALITQDPADASRFLKGVIEQIYYMTKLTSIGMDERYRVDIYAKKITRAPLRSLQRSYNAKYFPCYRSHSQAAEGSAKPVEKAIDDRGSILKGAMFRIGLPVALVVFAVSVYGVIRFFTPKEERQLQAAETKQQPQQIAQVQQQPERPEIASKWRSLGWYGVGNAVTVTVINDAGDVRLIANPPKLKISASGAEVELPEGGFAVPWQTGAAKVGPL